MTAMGTHARNLRHAVTGTSRAGTYPWPLLFIAAPAAVAIWSGWVGLGSMSGFGPVNLLPGVGRGFHLNTAITLPVGIEAYGVYAMFAWLALKSASDRTRDFARRSSITALVLGCLGQIAYHMMAAAGWVRAPWFLVMLVSCLPVVTVYLGATLTHLILADRRDAAEAKAAAEKSAADAERARAERAAARAELAAQRKPRKAGTGTAQRKRNKPAPEPRQVPEPAPEPEPEPAPEESVDLAAEARILTALSDGTMDTEKGILALVANGRKPSQAGKLAGRSDSYGRKVVRMARDLSEAAPSGGEGN